MHQLVKVNLLVFFVYLVVKIASTKQYGVQVYQIHKMEE